MGSKIVSMLTANGVMLKAKKDCRQCFGVIGGIVSLSPLNRPGCGDSFLQSTNWVGFGVLIGFYHWGGVEG